MPRPSLRPPSLRRAFTIAVAVIVLACIAWSAWWYVAAGAETRAVENWLADRRAEGWQAEAASIEVTGFPTDFRLVIREPVLADPATGWAWTAPALVAASKAWAPTRVAVDWPPGQSVAVPGERAAVSTTSMASLIDLRPGTALELREAATELSGLEIESSTGWSAAADTASIRVTERPDDLAPPNSYDIRISADALQLPDMLVERIDPTGALRTRVDRVTVIGHVALAEPLGIATIETGDIVLRAATLREVGFDWGEMALVVSGSFTVDDQGYPDGEMRVEAREWRRMVDLAVGAGLIGRETAGAVTQAIEFLTMLTGSGDDISVPFNLSGGKLRIGPVAVADVPRLAPPRRVSPGG